MSHLALCFNPHYVRRGLSSSYIQANGSVQSIFDHNQEPDNLVKAYSAAEDFLDFVPKSAEYIICFYMELDRFIIRHECGFSILFSVFQHIWNITYFLCVRVCVLYNSLSTSSEMVSIYLNNISLSGDQVCLYTAHTHINFF